MTFVFLSKNTKNNFNSTKAWQDLKISFTVHFPTNQTEHKP